MEFRCEPELLPTISSVVGQIEPKTPLRHRHGRLDAMSIGEEEEVEGFDDDDEEEDADDELGDDFDDDFDEEFDDDFEEDPDDVDDPEGDDKAVEGHAGGNRLFAAL